MPDRRVGTMSKGMQQRLGLAQALIGSPRLLLLDEPTSALDPAGRRLVRALLERLRDRGVAVLLNSHLLSEVELVCDRVAIIDHGAVVAAGTPAELSRPGGVEVETAAGVRRFAATRRATTRRGSCATSSRPARTSTRCGCCTSSLEDAYLEAVGARRRSADGRAGAGGGMSATVAAEPGRAPPGELRGALIVARFSLQESLRRRVFVVVGLLTLAVPRALRAR